MTEPRSTAATQPLSPADEHLWSTLAHIGNIVGFLPSLLILLLLGPRSARVRTEAREALNFVITATAAWVVLLVVGRVLDAMASVAPTGVDLGLSLLGFLVGLLQFAIWVLVVVFSIVAAVRANSGGSFRYPLSARIIR